MSLLSPLTRALAPFRRYEPVPVRFDVRAAKAGGLVPRWEADKPQWLPSNVARFDQTYRTVTLIFSCVQYLAHATGTAPLRIYNPADKPMDAHPFRQLMVRPNPHMGEGRFLSFVAMNMAVTNFVVIEKERDRLGNVVGLWPLRSDWVRPIPREHDAPDWEYRVPGDATPIVLDAGDVIPITFADTPDWRYTGTGPMEAVFREAQISTALSDFLKAFMDRGSIPLYMLIPSDDPGLASQFTQPGVKDTFMAAWRQRYGGLIPSSTEPLLSPGIKDIKRVGLDFNELAYPELNSLVDARICQAFGVPAILVGAEVGLDRSTFSNGEQAAQNFWGGTMQRLWSRIDDAFTRHLLPEFETRPGWDCHFDTSKVAALQENADTLYARVTAAFTAGLISRTVAQTEIGIEPHGEDVFILPLLGAVPVDAPAEMPALPAPPAQSPPPALPAGEEPPPEETPPPAPQRAVTVREVPPPPAPEPPALPAPEPAPEPEPEPDPPPPPETEPAPRMVTRDGRTYVNERALDAAEIERRASAASSRRHEMARFAGEAEPIVAAYLDGQRSRVIDALTTRQSAFGTMLATPEGMRPAANAAAADLIATKALGAIDWAQEANDLLSALHGWLGRVGAAVFRRVGIETGTPDVWDVTPAWHERLEAQLAQRVVGITAQTRQDIARIVVQAVQDGTTTADLAGKLQGLYEETYAGRSMTIARTETMYAHNHSTVMSYEASGVVNHVQLLDNPAHDTDPGGDGLTCAERNGLVVKLADAPAHIAGEHPNGTLSMVALLGGEA